MWVLWEKFERRTLLEFKIHLDFSMGKECVKCASYIRSNVVLGGELINLWLYKENNKLRD
jgi:hypothetical protein